MVIISQKKITNFFNDLMILAWASPFKDEIIPALIISCDPLDKGKFHYPPGYLAGQAYCCEKRAHNLNRHIFTLKCKILFTKFITAVTYMKH